MFGSDHVSSPTRWPLVRISVGGKTRVVLLSSSFLPLTVHWVGRSIVCPGDDCLLCSWLPSRALYYVACSVESRVSILELGSLSSSHLEQHLGLLHGGMRPGLLLEFHRRSAKSPVYGECVDEMSGCQAVDHLALASRVMALYHLPPANPGEDFEKYELRLKRMASIRSGHEDARLRKSFEVGTKPQA